MGNEEVGKISYSVTIDVSALKSGAKSAEQAVKTSFNSSEKAMASSTKSMERSAQSAAQGMLALAGSIVALRQVGNFLGSAIDSANRYQAALLGLNSVSLSFTGETDAATQAAIDLSSDGLMPLTDTANSLKNLLASGFNLEQATTLMKAFKDNAAFGHQAALTFGESVRGATEGIKNGNSILVDNIGLTKNLSMILKEAGYAETDLMRATTDVGVRTALFNGLLKETAPFLGDAASLAETAAGADAQLAFATNQLEVRLGSLANALRKDAIAGLAQFVMQNKDTIISVGSGAVAMVTFAAAAYGLSKSIMVLRAAMTLISTHPIVAVLTLMAGILAGFMTNNLLSDVAEGLDDTGNGASGAATSMDVASDSAEDLAKKLRELDDQVTKVNRDYSENLAQIVKDHQKSITDLTKQILDENKNYDAAVRERFATFKDEQGKEQVEHSKKTKSLQNQIDFLRKYSNASNKQQLSELQFALAQENAQYDKRNAELQEKYNADVAAEQLSYQQKLLSNQTKLDEETALLAKHAEDVASIRDVILLDEIDSLKRARQEQLISLEKQKQDAISGNKNAGASAGQAFADEYTKKLNELAASAGSIGASAGRNFFDEMGDWAGQNSVIRNMQDNFQRNWEANGGDFWKPMKDSLGRAWGLFSGEKKSGSSGGWATGGFTGTGGVNDVAGLVHKGEYVLPQSMVNQASGLPKPEAMASMSGGGDSSSSTYNITIPISGAIVSSPQDQRKFAEVIGKKLNEIMQQKGYVPSIKGV